LKALLWHDATRIDQYCYLRDKVQASLVLQNALSLAPRDQTLREMAAACGLDSHLQALENSR
jgi:hypothetical protein